MNVHEKQHTGFCFKKNEIFLSFSHIIRREHEKRKIHSFIGHINVWPVCDRIEVKNNFERKNEIHWPAQMNICI